MKEYIELKAAVDLAMQYCPDDDGACSKEDRDIRELLDELEALPAADVIPVVHSRWVLGGYDDMYYVCEKCRHKQSEYYIKPTANFCPNCGAKMDTQREE